MNLGCTDIHCLIKWDTATSTPQISTKPESGYQLCLPIQWRKLTNTCNTCNSFTVSAHWQSLTQCSWNRSMCLRCVWSGHHLATAVATYTPPFPTGPTSPNALHRMNRWAGNVQIAHNGTSWRQARHGFHGWLHPAPLHWSSSCSTWNAETAAETGRLTS